MSVAVPTLASPRLTPEDLERLSDDGHIYELVDGELRKLNMSQESSWIACQISRLLPPAVNKIGWVYGADAGFQCFTDDPDMVRKPDLAFVSRDRQPAGPAQRGYGRICPDFVVEVVSPGDIADDVHDKIQLWLDAGVQLVWVVWPKTRSVEVRTSAGSRHLRGQDILDTQPVIPDFQCAADELFPPR